MARGRKSLSLDEQLVKINIEIDKLEHSLKELKQSKKTLEEQIKMNKLTELDELISEKGLSLDDVKKLLEHKDNLSDK